MNAATKTASPSKVTTPTDRTIQVERIFNAPRERVWQAYTDPKLLAQWWGRGNKRIERYELERGGHWRFVEHSGDHGAHGFEGRFREVTPMERISMTFEWDGMPGYPAVTTAVFEDLGGGRTKVISTMQFYTPELRDSMLHSGMEGGMNQSYAALAVPGADELTEDRSTSVRCSMEARCRASIPRRRSQHVTPTKHRFRALGSRLVPVRLLARHPDIVP